MTGPQIIVLATPVFLALIALEFIVGVKRGRNTYRLNDALASIGLGVMSQVTGLYGRLLRIGLYTLAFEHVSLTTLAVDSIWTWVFALLAYDRASGKVIGNFGRSGTFPGQFNQPHGIAVDSTGNIYIAENRGRRIHKFTIATR